MELLADPNVSYVLLILGFLTAVLALLSPGTGVLEVIALFALAVAGFGIANLPINWWAIALMGLGLIPFALALANKTRLRIVLLTTAALLFVVGSTFLFRGESWHPAVNLFLVILLSPVAIGATWWIAEKSIEAVTAQPVFDLERLNYMTGEVTSDIRGQGTVYVDGEEWSAISSRFIPVGTRIRVTGRKGLVLEVEPLDH